MMRHSISSAVFAIALAVSLPASAESVCRHYAEAMQTRAFAIIKDPALDVEQKRTSLLHIFKDSLDLNWVAEKVTGQYWAAASEAERKDFLVVYGNYLASHYIGKLDENAIANLTNVKISHFEDKGAGSFLVHADIEQKGDEPISIDYRLAEQPAGVCHARDFTLEGVSMVKSQSEEIQSLAANGGLKIVTARLNELTH